MVSGQKTWDSYLFALWQWQFCPIIFKHVSSFKHEINHISQFTFQKSEAIKDKKTFTTVTCFKYCMLPFVCMTIKSTQKNQILQASKSPSSDFSVNCFWYIFEDYSSSITPHFKALLVQQVHDISLVDFSLVWLFPTLFLFSSPHYCVPYYVLEKVNSLPF